MSEAPPSASALDFDDRFARLGRTLGEREREHAGKLAEARRCAETLRSAVAAALEDFHRAAREAGSSHLEIGLSDIRTDDKHVRAVEFEIFRGRHRAIVTAKSRGEVTLVGPFHSGKTEGPCRTFPFDTSPELRDALGDFLEQFLEEAAAP
jgi:hypothetical protein